MNEYTTKQNNFQSTCFQNVVGVDTHKDTIACFYKGRFREFKTNEEGFKKALDWVLNWAIEGAYCYGLSFASFLCNFGCKVYEINPLLTKAWRTYLKVSSPKNDYGDSLVKQKTQIINFIKMNFYTRGERLSFNLLDTKKAINF